MIDDKIFKAYDIRGVYGQQFDDETVVSIVKAYVSVINPQEVVVGRDGRISGPAIHKQVLDTLVKLGVNVVDIGLVSSDMYYYACATKQLPGIMITASHNPKEYNGFKMVRQIPYFLTGDDEIARIKSMVLSNTFPDSQIGPQGQVTNWDIMAEFLEYLGTLVDLDFSKKFTVLADTANGMVGPILKAIESKISNLQLIPMYFDVDGNFPNHGGDPLIADNRTEIEKRVISEADFGVMFDPDGDRYFVIDKKGRFVSGDFFTAIMSEHFLDKYPGSNIVYDIRASKVVPETITKHGGVPLYNRVGHSYIKKRMIDENAIFGGEVTGHYYFKDFFYCDSGILAFLFTLSYLSTSDKTLDEIVDQMESEYFLSGEINSKVEDVSKVLERLEVKYKDQASQVLKVDGVSCEFDDWRFNVRGSNTEPLIRLNLEAKNKELMEQKRDEVLSQIRS